MDVFGHACAPGQKYYFSVDGPLYANGARMQIPVIVLRGTQDGPTFWINGCVHGDELNGSAAAWELMGELDPAKLKGNIVVTPVANVAAFTEHTKNSNIDELDMDTQFPGDAEGFLCQILAKILYDEMKRHASFLINFHTISKLYDAKPYTVSKKVAGANPSVNVRALELALGFGVKANCVVDLATASGELPGVTRGALDITCIGDGIPAFMGEMGHGGVIDPNIVEVAKRGLRNVMIMQGMIEGTVAKGQNQVRITKRKFVRSQTAGIIRVNTRPGDIVRAGDNIADFHYFGDRLTPYRVQQDSYIIATRAYPVINTGDRVAFLGLEWEYI